jgi:thiol-disulfide isomerase/thioredoxin
MVFSFAYEAYEGSFPDFVLENLSRGVVLLSYRTDACAACDRMEPIIASLFNLTSLDELLTTSKFDGVNVTLIHINLDHAEEELRNSYNVYNILGDRGGVPMFSIITYGRDRGVVKPAYATGYGFLGKPTPEQGKDILKQMIEKGIDLYIQNRPLVD